MHANNYNNIFNNLHIIMDGFSANWAGFAEQDAPQTRRSSNHTKAEAMLTVQSSYVGSNQLVKGGMEIIGAALSCSKCYRDRAAEPPTNPVGSSISAPFFPPCTHEQQ